MPALSVTVSTPVRVPLAVGVKLMESEQEVCAARVAVQVLAAIVKSPVIVGGLSVAGLAPVLATVMICGAALWLTSVAGKLSVSGVSTTAAAAVAAPLRVTVACPPGMLA